MTIQMTYVEVILVVIAAVLVGGVLGLYFANFLFDLIDRIE